ncbi:hypothetical protein [Frisingicoccus sp.]|uniref:hypothetical protein n=1 Tax=Frisingicoccus sp. TaxID=1918627 RepID=UPI00399B0A8A
MPKKLSAKDKAFESERIAFRKKIREKDTEIQILKSQLTDTQTEAAELKTKVAELNDWIERLLSYTELSKEEMQNIIQAEKLKANIINELNVLYNFLK